MSARALAGLFVACFVLVVIATFPLSVAVRAVDAPGRAVSFARVSGTIWNGRIDGLSWRGHDLGAAHIVFRPLSLLVGRLGLDVALDGGGMISGSGFIGLKPAGLVVSDLTLSADVAALPILMPLSGQVALDVGRADLTRNGCRAAEGSVRTDALVHRPAGLPWKGPVLAGPITCANGAIVIPMRGDTEAGPIAVALTLARDGTFGVQVDARAPNSAVAGLLSGIGFVEKGGVMTLTQRGRWI